MIASVFIASLFVQSPVPADRALGSLTLDLAKLERAGTCTYDFVLLAKGGDSAKPTGTLQAVTRVEGDRVILIDSWTLSHGGRERKIEVTQIGNKDNFLSPVQLVLNGDGDEEALVIDVSVRVADPATAKAGMLSLDDGDKGLALPPQTLTTGALLRIVSLMPREKGIRVSFPFWLESEELHLKKDHVIECLGPDPITIGGRTVRCTKYSHTGGGIRGDSLWVDEEGVLQRILVDDRKELTRRMTEAGTGKSGPVKRESGGQ